MAILLLEPRAPSLLHGTTPCTALTVRSSGGRMGVYPGVRVYTGREGVYPPWYTPGVYREVYYTYHGIPGCI